MGGRFFVNFVAALICTQAIFGGVQAQNSTSASGSDTNTTSTTNATSAITANMTIFNYSSTATYNLATGAEIYLVDQSGNEFGYVAFLSLPNVAVTLSMPNFTAAQISGYSAQSLLPYSVRPVYVSFNDTVNTTVTVGWLNSSTSLSATSYNASTQTWYSFNTSNAWQKTPKSLLLNDAGSSFIVDGAVPVVGSSASFGVLAAANLTGTSQVLTTNGTATYTVAAGVAPTLSVTDSTGKQLIQIAGLTGTGGTVSVKVYSDAATATAAVDTTSGNVLISQIIDINYSGSLLSPAALQYPLTSYDATKSYSWMTLVSGKWVITDGSSSAISQNSAGQNVVTTTVPHFSPWAVQSYVATTTTTTPAATTAAPKTTSAASVVAPLSALLTLAVAALL